MQGDSKCCDVNQIAEEFHNQLTGYLIKKIRRPELAKDLVQEVMLKLVIAGNQNLKINNIKAWLFEIARHCLADHYRKSAKLKETGLDITQTGSLISQEESSYANGDFLNHLINLLPEQYSKPLYLSDIENLPQKIVAERLRLNLSATKMRIQRARKMLRELIIQCCDIEYTKDGAFADCMVKNDCTFLLSKENMV